MTHWANCLCSKYLNNILYYSNISNKEVFYKETSNFWIIDSHFLLAIKLWMLKSGNQSPKYYSNKLLCLVNAGFKFSSLNMFLIIIIQYLLLSIHILFAWVNGHIGISTGKAYIIWTEYVPLCFKLVHVSLHETHMLWNKTSLASNRSGS